MLSCFAVVISTVLGAVSMPTLSTSSMQSVVQQERPVLVLYYSPACPYSQKVLKYLQQIHRTVPMKSVVNNPDAKKELKEYGGKMQVPCLLIDGKPLYESNSIIQWLSQHQESLDPA